MSVNEVRPTVERLQEVATPSAMMTLGLGCLYMMTSAALISWNKFLMHPGRFPFAMSLVLGHSLACTVFAAILYFVKPDLFPSLTNAATRITVDRQLMLRGVLPIAFFFSVQLVLSNMAYLHLSVAFLQMMKESNLVLVFGLSLFFGLEVFNWRSIGILAFVIFATAITIHGEMHFDLHGFIVQGTGQVFECTKIVLQAVLLTAAGKKMDALSYVLLVMPMCFMLLGTSVTFIHFFTPDEYSHHIPLPEMHHFVTWAPHLVGNACVAFALNVIIALFIKNSSAVAFILAGIVKDCMIVSAGAMFFNEYISIIQVVGFGMQLFGILIWSMTKIYPEEFANGIVPGFQALALKANGVDKLQIQAKGYSTMEDGTSKGKSSTPRN